MGTLKFAADTIVCHCFSATNEELFTNIAMGQLYFPSPSWDNISNLAKVILFADSIRIGEVTKWLRLVA